MAGFFGLFDYTKEGKGVYPDDPPKGPVATFFGVLGRKFWKLCAINLMYILFSLPALILAVFGATYILSVLMPELTLETLTTIVREAGFELQEGVSFEEFAATQLMIVYFLFGMLLTGLSLIIVGPVHAGVTYLLRNYSREEHAFIWMDFKDHLRKNLKQSLLAGLISLVVTLVFTVNFAFYSSSEFIGAGFLRTFLQTIMVVLFVLWCIIQMYLYPMMITFDLKLKQLYKNCLMFSILRLPLNILILILSMVILFIIPGFLFMLGYGFSVLLAFVWYLFLAFAINLLLTNFFVYRGLDKYMIQRLKATEEEEEKEEAESFREDEIPEEDEVAEDDEKEEDSGGLVESPSGAKS